MTWSVTRSESPSASAKPFKDNSTIPVIKSQVNSITNYIVGKKKKKRNYPAFNSTFEEQAPEQMHLYSI